MDTKLSELKLTKIRKVLEFEIEGEKKKITIYNAIGKTRKNLISVLQAGNEIEDKNSAANMLYKSILKELVDIDIDLKNVLGLDKAPTLTLLQLNHEIDEIMTELQCEYIYNQMRMLNQVKISTLTTISLGKMNNIKEEVEKLQDANV